MLRKIGTTVKKIVVKTTVLSVNVVNWLMGLTYLLLATGAMLAFAESGVEETYIYVVGGICACCGVFILPSVRRQLSKRANIGVPGVVVGFVFVVGLVSMYGLTLVDTPTDRTSYDSTHQMGDPFTVNESEDGAVVVNVTHTQVFRSVDTIRGNTVTPYNDNQFLVVAMTLENTGTHAVAVSDLHPVAVADKGDREATSDPSPKSLNISLSNSVEYNRDIIRYSTRKQPDVEVEPGNTRRVAIAYEVERSDEYHLELNTRTQTRAESHRVPLPTAGRVLG